MSNANSESKSPEEKIVDDHRQMLLLSGNLSDFQLDNMKKWGFIIFGKDLKQATINYDFALEEEKVDLESGRNLHAGSVTYDFTFHKPQDGIQMEIAKNILELWTKFMFWKDTSVIIKVEGVKWEA